ncbi:MAG: FecR family protein [Haliea sp.]|uniref:FecR family protein n=1 Tax=Haliea sp. TaxID=1932666 RepID=UPI0032EBCEDA
MSDIRSLSRSDIDLEACAWIAQLDGAKPSAADIEALREWMNRSPRHREALERLSHLWGELNVLTELAVPPRPVRHDRRLARPLFAGMLAIIAVAALFITYWFDQAVPSSPILYATAVGEQRSVALPDGSSVQLNTASQLRVAYRGEVRELHLLAGEAYFEVAHEAGRPFIVWVGGRSVRAVGTAFSVRRETQGLRLLVTEGIVELAEGGGKPEESIDRHGRSAVLGTVKRGQRVRLAETVETAEPVSDEQIARELAWRQGMLSFAGEPLAVVIGEIGRYTETHFVIEDPELRNLRIGGYFRIGDTDAMLDTLASGFPIEVERVDDSTVLLRPSQ